MLKTVEISRRSVTVPSPFTKASKAGVTMSVRFFLAFLDIRDVLIALKTILDTGLPSFLFCFTLFFFLVAVTADPHFESLADGSTFRALVYETEPTRALVYVGVWCDDFEGLHILFVVVILIAHA